jgi:hypothetical protein
MTAIDPYAQPEYGRGTAQVVAVFPEGTLTVADTLTTVPYNVTWLYDHPDGIPQSEYRVEIIKSGVVVYSTGWVKSVTARSHQITAPHGLSDGLADIRLSVAAQNRGYQDTDTKTVTTTFGIPTLTWVYPDPLVGKIDETLVTVDWDYVDTQGKAQAQYRVVLEHGSEFVYDSTWLAGAATTHAIPYLLSPGSRYRAGVKVRNTNQVESG